MPVIEGLQEDSDGLITELSPMMVLHLFSVVELTVAQKELYGEFGEVEFQAFQEALHTMMARGLLAEC